MAGGPLHWFRKNQKILLVVSTVLLMIVFTVGGVLDSLFSGQNQGGAPVRTVATTSFGSFTNRDMEEFAEGNRRTAEFTYELYVLSGDPTKAKAVPISALNTSSTEARDRDILSRLAFAKFAEENGMYVGEEIIGDYFNMLCNNELSNVGKSVEQFSRELQRGSLSTVKAHLKTELLARCGQQMISSGVNPQFNQQGFLVGVSPTPVEIWEGHRRLRERFKIEFMSLDVPSTDSISAEPSEDEMQKLYEEGLDRAPNVALIPGFKSPRTATVSYFAINRKDVLEAEKKKITEQEIQTLYNEWVENEDFRVVESPAAGLAPGGGAFIPNPNVNNNQDGKAGDDEAPQLNPPSNDSPTPEKAAGDANKADAKKGDADPKTSEDADPKSGTEKAKGTDGTEKKQSGRQTESPFQFVSLIQEPAQQGDSKQEDARKSAVNAAKQDEAPKANPPAPTSNQQEKPEPPGPDLPESDSTIPDSVPPKGVQDEKPKIKPLDDELRDQIREELARPKADEIIQKGIDDAKSIVADYLNDYDYYTENPEEADFFETPDFEKIAADNGMTFKQLKGIDYRTLRKMDFGQASVVSPDPRRQAGQVAEEIFFATFRTGSNFEINTTRPINDIEYIYWVIDKKFREKVSYADAKPQIIEYYKKIKAIEEAKAKAEKIVADVTAQSKTLSAVYEDEVKTSREFGWMEIDAAMEDMAQRNPQFVQQMPQFFNPKLGQIIPDKPEEAEPLEGIDHEFMAKVFALDKNEIGFATDADQEKVYVFQVIERNDVNPIQKEQFFNQYKFGLAQRNSQMDHGRALNEILSAEDLLEKYSVKWFGEPENK